MSKTRRNNNNRNNNSNCNRGGSQPKNGKPEYLDKDSKSEGKQEAPVRNNAAMYFSSPALAEQVSRISFNDFMGDTLDQFGSGTANMPTGLSVYLNPSIGYSTGLPNSGINMQGMKLYTTLSNSNAKTTIYGPQDVTTLILAMGEIISFIEWGRRALGVALTFNMRNRTYPIGVLETLGFDGESFGQNLATKRTDLNELINQFNNVPIIANLPYFVKCHNLYTTYYTDSESPMAGYWAFVPYSTWTLNEMASDQGTVLETTFFDGGDENKGKPVPWSSYISTLQHMIDALFGSATFNAIYSDILRLSGSMSLLHIELVTDDYSVIPEYNPMMNLQLHNSRALFEPDYTGEDSRLTKLNNVYPDVDHNGLVYKPGFSNAAYQLATDPSLFGKQLLDFPHSLGNPDLDQRIDATRYMTAAEGTFEVGGQTYLAYPCIPDHYVVKYAMYCRYAAKNRPSFTNDRVEFTRFLDANNMYDVVIGLQLSKFDHCPLIAVRDQGVGQDGSTKNNTIVGYIGDVDFWTTVNYDWLNKVNNLSMQGLFELR